MKESPGPEIGDRWLQWYQAARVGDLHAEASLLAELRPFFRSEVQRHSGRQVFGAWDASDIAQDVALKLLLLQPGQAFSGTTGMEFLGWLRTIAYHEFLDSVRGGKAQKRGGGKPTRHLPGDSVGEVTIPGDTSTPSQQLIRSEEQKERQEALSRLPEKDQQVIRLRCFDKLSWAEIAPIMDKSV